MNDETIRSTAKDLKKGKLVIIDNEPCRVINVQLSKSGKHGAAKARIDAVSLFTGNKKSEMKPSDGEVEVPMIKRKIAQVVAIMGDNKLQLMDLETFENYEITIPIEFKDKIEQGKEVEIQEVMGHRTIERLK